MFNVFLNRIRAAYEVFLFHFFIKSFCNCSLLFVVGENLCVLCHYDEFLEAMRKIPFIVGVRVLLLDGDVAFDHFEVPRRRINDSGSSL